jgi:uncharacterized membrane protein YdjX (TVP38/TMEM64 family)
MRPTSPGSRNPPDSRIRRFKWHVGSAETGGLVYSYYRNTIKWVVIAIVSLAALVCLIVNIDMDWRQWITFIVNRDTHPLLFVLLLLVLPLVGFPISLFMVLSGIKFGWLAGLCLFAIVIPLHLLAAYLIAGLVLRPWLVTILSKRGHHIPRLPRKDREFYVFLFMVIPGLPYMIKNYLLSLSGIDLRIYIRTATLGALIIATPLITLGGAIAKGDAVFIFIVFIILITGYGVLGWLNRKSFKKRSDERS